MGTINLYRIETDRSEDFLKTLSRKMEQIDTIIIGKSNKEKKEDLFGCTLFLSVPNEKKELSWNWLLRQFDVEEISFEFTPKAVLVIKKNDDEIYAVTFGHAFFLVDKYCDRDFGFNFARKLEYEEIKTTTLTTPGMQRNKVVNTYINYSELEFDSGESFAKLKARQLVDEEFDLYKPSVEIGASIRVSALSDTLEHIIRIIQYVEEKMNEDDICHIPVFVMIKDKEYIKSLDRGLESAIAEGLATVNISELEIIGATEVFNHNDEIITLKFGKYEKNIAVLSIDEVKSFCDENDIDYCNNLLSIKVIRYYNGDPLPSCTVREIIDSTLEMEKCLLSKGIWYKYNDDYLMYLKDSLAQIETIYLPEYDFSEKIHNDYIESLYQIEKGEKNETAAEKEKSLEKLKRIHYAERAFNELRERDDGFKNFDRQEKTVGNTNIEVMDLYKQECMYAVKIGNSSGKLCYAVDQSLTSLKMLRMGELTDMPPITKVALWFVLERKDHIEDEDGKPDIDALEMLMLKNRLDQWKKEVRLQGYKPIIYINYRKK